MLREIPRSVEWDIVSRFECWFFHPDIFRLQELLFDQRFRSESSSVPYRDQRFVRLHVLLIVRFILRSQLRWDYSGVFLCLDSFNESALCVQSQRQ